MNTRIQKPQFDVQRNAERYFGNHGWLRTFHSFSFAEYIDPNKMNWGALRVFNDDRVAAGQGFGEHPHRDMEIISYVLEGQLEHRDSLGNHGVVSPGGVQYLSAGSGVRHSEFNHSKTEPLHFIQMWVLPRHRVAQPLYGQRNFDVADRRDRWLVIASGVNGTDSPIRLDRDATFLVTRLEKATLSHRFDQDRLGFLFAADGDIEVELDGPSGASYTLSTGDAARIAGIESITLRGQGEAVLWDVPELPTDA